MSEFPSRDEFYKQLNTKFRAEINAEQTVEMELTDVSELRQQTRYEAFSLVFIAPNDFPPEQMLYKMQHDTLGEMELMLVPFDRDEKGLHFEALFNQPIKAAGG